MKKDKRRSGTGRAPATPEAEQPAAAAIIPVVALGGSAGALEPFNQFFAGMPADSGAAFVVIQHLSPTHESLLPDLLARHTRMKVVQARDGVPVEPNCVYVIPPNQDLGIREGVLYLAETVRQRGIPMPIDFFLRTLAEDRQERAVCVLLSGAGSDGTMGVRAIRGAGGLTLAQDPETAQYGDLPRSAIATRLVDRILRPEQMPEAVVDYLQQPYVRGGEPPAAVEAEGKSGGLQDILAVVRNQTSCDFRCYKKQTILRRIERRMGLRQIADLEQYGKLLGQDAVEVRQLLQDLLINVTAFFRDAEVFEELRSKVIAPLITARSPDEPLRVWVAGCSTGEEAYSLAILLMEEMATARKSFPVQIFATDIDEDALQVARQGCYPESIIADVEPERLAKFFVRKEHGYQIVDSVRNAVVFAAQNLISDPPFSRLDLISCRNLLIYLDADTQAKLVPLFHFALIPGGALFLGKSEGVGGPTDLFSLVSKKAKIFRRSNLSRPMVLDSPFVPGKKKIMPVPGAAMKLPSATYADAIRQALLHHFAASVVLVGTNGQILQFHGQTGKYLDMPAAEPNLNLLDIAKEGLSLRLRSALHAANDEKKTVVMDGIPITRNTAGPCARVTVTPVAQRGAAESLLAVIFEDVSRPAIVGVELPRGPADETSVRQLEDELRLTQQDLQANIEELQASNEEMRVSNEEVVSANEELQSTNEELETSKEELQSVNEELTTVNSQLQEKVEQLDVAYGDMANLLKSTQIATLFLDPQLRIKFFTPATTQVLKLISSDTGRPVSDLSISFVDYDLTADARAVAQGGAAIERDVRHADGSYYIVRFMPYRTQHDRVEGVVVTFENVTRLRLATEHERFLAEVVETANMPFGVGAPDGRLVTFNQAFADLTGYSREELLQRQFTWATDLTPEEWRASENVQLAEVVRTRQSVRYEKEYLRKDGTRVPIELFVQPAFDAAGNLLHYRCFLTDITERKRAEEALRASEAKVTAAFASMSEAIFIADAGGRLVDFNDEFVRYHRFKDRDECSRTIADCPKYLEAFFADGTPAPPEQWAMPRALRGETASNFEYRLRRKETGETWWGSYNFAPIKDKDGGIAGAVVSAREITALKQAESALSESERKLALAASGTRIGIFEWDVVTGEVAATVPVMQLMGMSPTTTTTTTTTTLSQTYSYRDWAGRVHPEDLPATVAAIERSRTQRLPFDTEYRVTWPDGSLHWLAARGVFQYDEAGAATRFLGIVMDIAERRQAEAAVRQSESRYRSLFDTMIEGFCIIEVIFDGREKPVDYRFLEVNPAFETQTGLHNAQGKLMRDLAPEHEAQWFEMYGRIARSGEPARFVNEAKALDRWFEVSAYRVGGSESRKVAILFNDITEHKRAEKLLRESEDRFRTLANAMPQLAWIGRPDGHLVWYNQRWYQYTGTTPKQMEGWGWQSVHDPDELPKVLERWKASIATGEPFEMTFPLRGADGHFRPFLTRGYPLKDKDGRILQWFGTNTDITELKQAEEEIQRSQQLLQAIIDNSPALIYVKDLEGRITIANQALGDAVGMPAQDILGKTSREFIRDPAAGEAHMANDRLIVASGQPLTVEEATPGHVFLSVKFPLRDAQGGIFGTGGVSTDITERKQTEKLLSFLGQSAGDAGEGFFPKLARHLAQALNMDFVCIDRLEEDRLTAQTLAVFHNGKFEDNVSYALKDTPCGDVVGKRICCFPRNVRALFARDAVLQDLQAESYLGTTLWSTQGKPIGLIAVISRQPLADTRLAESLLQVVAVRAAGELERQQMENTLRESEERLQLALVASEMATFEWDIAANKRIWSAGVHRLLGTTPETFTGNTEEFMRVVHPDDRNAVQANIARALETGVYENEYRAVWPDGSIHHIAAKGKMYRDSEGRPVRLSGICWDITQRKQIEDNLRRHTEELTRFNRAMVGRELRMIDLKKQVNALCVQLGQPVQYPMDFEKEKERH